jgi:hypothetical protein
MGKLVIVPAKKFVPLYTEEVFDKFQLDAYDIMFRHERVPRKLKKRLNKKKIDLNEFMIARKINKIKENEKS